MSCTHPHSSSVRCSPKGVAAYVACALQTAASFGARGSGKMRPCSADLTMGGRGWGWPVMGRLVPFFGNHGAPAACTENESEYV